LLALSIICLTMLGCAPAKLNGHTTDTVCGSACDVVMTNNNNNENKNLCIVVVLD
jgi:hypothetical protein